MGPGAFATGGAFLLLTWAQTRVDATTAAVILTLESVFGALTAVSLGETMSLKVTVGALAVTAAAVLVAPPHNTVSSPSGPRTLLISLQRDRFGPLGDCASNVANTVAIVSLKPSGAR